MLRLPPTMTEIEAARVGVALGGLLFTLGCLFVTARAAKYIAQLVQAKVLVWDGPRWTYAFGMVIVMLFFIPGWLCFLASGIMAAEIPQNPATTERTTDTLGLLVLGGEVFFALGQAAILLVWYRVKAVTMSVPRWTPPEVRI